MRLVLTLALAQLRHQALRWLLLIVGLALVVAVPVITAGLARSVDARTVRRTVSSLDVADRTLLVTQEVGSSLTRGTPATADAAVRRQLGTLTSAVIVRELRYRPISGAGTTFLLGGADDLARGVALTAGRLPRSCTPTRCEVVVVAGAGASVMPALTRAARTIGVVVVGAARRTSPVLATGQLAPGRTPLLLADGAEPAGRIAALSLFSHYYAWTAPLQPDDVIARGTDAWLADAERVNERLAAGVGGTSVSTPSDALQAGADRARASARRLDLLGGFTAVLLVGFAVVAAAGLRREQELLGLTLRRRGATGPQRVGVTLVEVATGAVLATLLGASVAAVTVAGTWYSGTGLGPAAAAGHALAHAGVGVLALGLGGAVAVAAVLLWPDTRPREVWRVLDVVALAALGAAVLAAGRGSTSAGALTGGGDPLVIALPVLTAVTAGILAARLWRPAGLLLDRLAGYRVLAVRLALVGAVRRPLRPTSAVAFLAAAVTAVVFTGTYRATLLANDRDQAAFQVPLGHRLQGSESEPVPAVPGAALGAGVRAFDVVRSPASVPSVPGAATAATLVAPGTGALPLAQRWARTTGSDRSLGSVAAALRVAAPPAPRLPAGTRTITVPVRGFDRDTVLSMWVRDAAGTTRTVSLRVAAGRGTASVPDLGGGPVSVVAVGLALTVDAANRRAHGLGEGTTDRGLLAGALTLGAPSAQGRDVPWSWAGWGSLTGGVRAGGATLRLAYRLGTAPIVLVPHFGAAHATVLPVIVSPDLATAADNGSLAVTLDGSTPLPVRVVGTLPRLPTVSGPFLLADLTSLRVVLDQTQPGLAPDEVWVHGSSAALTRFLAGTALVVTSSSVVRSGLDSDPIGAGTRTLLALVAGLALAAAAVALMLLVVGERRDGAAELYTWEADGVAPATLRRMLAARAVLVALVGVPVGVGAGLVLAHAGTRLVAVDATGTTPTPPIQVASGGAVTSLVLAAGIGAGLLAGVLVAAGSLRERYARAPEADLR